MLTGMKNHGEMAAKASQNVADRLAWQTAHKDQAGISRELASGKEIPEVYGLGEAGPSMNSFSFSITWFIRQMHPFGFYALREF